MNHKINFPNCYTKDQELKEEQALLQDFLKIFLGNSSKKLIILLKNLVNKYIFW